jgi:hypothetical protein
VSADAVQAGSAEPAIELVGVEFDVVEIVRANRFCSRSTT